MSKPIWTTSEWSFDLLQKSYEEIEKIGIGELGLNIYKNQFEIISADQMLDAYCSVGMPIYYSHWSFGKQFSREWESYKSGRSGLAYELVINSDPCINYLMEDNSMTTQALVQAHAALGHNHFFKNNYMFKTWTNADAIVDYLIFAKEFVAKTEEREGRANVESFLDSCHALQEYGVDRYKRPGKLSIEKERERQREREDYLQSRVDEMYRIIPSKPQTFAQKLGITPAERFPAQPEDNLLYFCEKHSPTLKPWQRELIRIVRKMAQYFYPQGQTKVANEGFASWTHYTIMNRLHDKGLTTDGAHLEFLALHAGVLFQPDWNDRRYSGLNPYKLGFEILRDIERICTQPTDEDRRYFSNIIGENPVDVIKEVVANYRDESFIRQFLSPKIVRDFKFMRLHDDREEDFYTVTAIQDDSGFLELRDSLADTYERDGRLPQIDIVKADFDTRTLTLRYSPTKGRELDDPAKMMWHVRKLWGADVVMKDTHGNPLYD